MILTMVYQRYDLIAVFKFKISFQVIDSDVRVRLSTLLQTSSFKMGIRDLWTVSANPESLLIF
jgi:hypothetical protein